MCLQKNSSPTACCSFQGDTTLQSECGEKLNPTQNQRRYSTVHRKTLHMYSMYESRSCNDLCLWFGGPHNKSFQGHSAVRPLPQQNRMREAPNQSSFQFFSLFCMGLGKYYFAKCRHPYFLAESSYVESLTDNQEEEILIKLYCSLTKIVSAYSPSV